MELNRELIQQSWLEVKHFFDALAQRRAVKARSVLADGFGCEEIHLVLSSLTPTSGAS
jgi:hypothetical protein